MTSPSSTSSTPWLPQERPLLARLVDSVFTVRCAGCDAPGAPLCHTCRLILLDAAQMASGSISGSPSGVIAAVELTGAVRRVIHGLKYRNRRAVVGHLAGLLLPRLIAAGSGPESGITAVTWAPTHRDRKIERGYDQAELLAREVARRLGLPAVCLLDRVDTAGSQTGRSRVERQNQPAFRGRPSHHRRVLLIDDVVTTGSTLAAARGALRTAAVEHIVTAAVAATPLATQPAKARVIATAA
jgi:predicted amidophosphoribosyltransferase